MIKAGQIYELPISRARFAVHDIVENSDDGIFDWIYIIFLDGHSDRLWRKTVEEMKLIAEYPTWQEAVNSKEFNEAQGN